MIGVYGQGIHVDKRQFMTPETGCNFEESAFMRRVRRDEGVIRFEKNGKVRCPRYGALPLSLVM